VGNLNIKKLSDNKLSLTNDGKLEMFFIGVGSAFNKTNYQTNLLIIKGNDHILVDCGTLCSYVLWQYGLLITGISNFLITHSHADHIGGLEEPALLGRYMTKNKPNMIVTEDYEHFLWENSLKGGIAYNERNNKVILKFNDVFNPIYPKLILKEPREYYETNLGSINIKLYRTMHIPDSAKSWNDSTISYGILIDDRILFPSDTRYDPDLIFEALKLYPTIEYIFHDCQAFKGGVHASYEELLNFPEDIRQKMFLTHYSDDLLKKDAEKDKFAGFAKRGIYYSFD
jgi:ribonuclease BN (tRNA processing enzyme)